MASATRRARVFEVGARGDEERIAFRAAEALRDPDLRGVLVFSKPLSLRLDARWLGDDAVRISPDFEVAAEHGAVRLTSF